MNTLREVNRRLRSTLAPKFGEREASAMVAFLWRELKGWSQVDLAIRADEPLSDFIVSKAEGVVARLLDNEPIQYIFSTAPFYGMDFKVDRSTLIPRPETAQLVDIIVDGNAGSDLRVIDFGTGSGCIAIALARNLKFADVTAVDISPDALAVAKENAARLKARVRFVEADMLAYESPDSFDIVVSNPPYITLSEQSAMERNVLDYEPASALFVPDDDPLKFYRAISAFASRSLAATGKIYFEINPLYARDIELMLTHDGYSHVEIIKDMDGKDRFATAIKSN